MSLAPPAARAAVTPLEHDRVRADVEIAPPTLPGYSSEPTHVTALDIDAAGKGRVEHTFVATKGTRSRVALTYLVEVAADGTSTTTLSQVTGQCGR